MPLGILPFTLSVKDIFIFLYIGVLNKADSWPMSLEGETNFLHLILLSQYIHQSIMIPNNLPLHEVTGPYCFSTTSKLIENRHYVEINR